MRRVRFDQLLAGTALATALALTATSSASAQSARAISNAVPMPQSADLPPPSLKDITSDKPAVVRTANTVEVTNTVSGAAGAKATAADAAIADKLREMMAAGKFDRILGSKKERTPVEAFYSGREFAPLWVADGAMSERAKNAAQYLSGIDADGLDPADYPLPQIKAGADAEALAEAEVRFTDAVLTFVRHAQSGRVHYSRVHTDIQYDLAKTDPAEVLAKLAGASDVAAALDGYNPQQPQYKALKAKLAEVRRGSDVEKKVIPSGPVLKYGKDKKGKEEIMSDERVPALRARFGMKSPEGNTNYDRELSAHDRQVPEGAQPAADRPAHAGDARRHQRPQARQDGRHHPRQHGALALGAARPRQDPRDGQHPGLHAARDARRQAGLEDARRGRQAEPADAADQRRDEVHHRQPDLERAAVDHPERIPAGAAAGPAWRWSASGSRSSRTATAPSASSSRRATATRSAASASTSRTSSWCISTTRRTSTCSPMSGAPTATAACACRTR